MQKYTNTGIPIEMVSLCDSTGYPISLSSSNFDAANRIRTSNVESVGDFNHIYPTNGQFYSITSGTGSTITFNSSKSCINLFSGTGSTSSAIYQTQSYHHYITGKSHLIYSTFQFGTGNTSSFQRIGYFDNLNGIYLQQKGTEISLVIRSNTSGSVQERIVPQTQWNIDKCDGTGKSGLSLDLTKSQLFWINFLWLGVGVVRCGFNYNGNFIAIHDFYHSNIFDGVYIQSPTLPIRIETRNLSASTGSTIQFICGSVMSEGGYNNAGYDWGVVGSSYINLAVGEEKPVLAIRLKNSFFGKPNRITTILNNFEIISTTSNVRYKLFKIPYSSYIVGGSWVSVHDNSAMEYNESMTSYSDGSCLTSGFVTASNIGQGAGNQTPTATSSQQISSGNTKKNFITQNFDSTDSQSYLLVAKNLDSVNSTGVIASMSFREVY